ncbi:MAG: hypothetical protein A2X32_08450 [Elusimicrobia bacterium GWC2_64_44]|nr:MAG: hypothetical protein A2X32_08450 [Elusimicrobia bacterium GWC2_64_44]
MNRTLLVADDDKQFQGLVGSIFRGTRWSVKTAGDGSSAMESLMNFPPDLVLLDLNMPGVDGREVLARMRHTPRLEMVPVIIVSGEDSPEARSAEFERGADDYICKPFDPVDLRSRVESADRRARRMLGANPLTLLPGGPAIEEEAWRRIKDGTPLAYFHIDIDNFKAYNDAYGHLRGDDVIRETAALLGRVQADFPEENVFLGHIGGDDFVLMSSLGRDERIAAAVAQRFDAAVGAFYGPQDRTRGFILSTDRQGGVREFPLMSLSIAMAASDRRELEHYARIADIAGEIKSYLKKLPGRTGSMYLKDRRRD